MCTCPSSCSVANPSYAWDKNSATATGSISRGSFNLDKSYPNVVEVRLLFGAISGASSFYVTGYNGPAMIWSFQRTSVPGAWVTVYNTSSPTGLGVIDFLGGPIQVAEVEVRLGACKRLHVPSMLHTQGLAAGPSKRAQVASAAEHALTMEP